MARLCTVCFHSDSTKINASLASGVALATISSQSTISESALRRHSVNHLGHALVRETSVSGTTATTDLIDRLQSALDDVDKVRVSALATGRGDLVIKAAAQTRALIDTMMARLGVDDLETVRLVRDAQNLARAVGRVTRIDPEFGHAVVRELNTLSTDTITADALTAMAVAAERKRQLEVTDLPTTKPSAH
jgi:hypothetical protein